MHFEFLVEDQSGKAMLKRLAPRIIAERDTFTIHPYRGVGRIPRGMKAKSDACKRILLDQLPRLLAGYGRVFKTYPDGYVAVVIVVCDLDDRDPGVFTEELKSVMNRISSAPRTKFCIAIEEGEAWFLGDTEAIKVAYPRAKQAVLSSYTSDSICGTWEKLADAIFPGGSQALIAKGYQAVGMEKTRWAENITPNMDLGQNRSPSFQRFRATLRKLAEL